MKKSNFVAMILGIISCLFFGLGMCMAMIPEWDAFTPGTVIGCVGIVFALITIFVWRKMEHKEPIKITGKAVLTAVVGIIGAFALGVGMCFSMVWGNMILGIVIGIAGIIILLCLIPLCKGLK
ncbi:MAG TPA: hypothetical protein H9740_03670 [Candidatus Hungatella pullicola]|nr:hypothetical protein [Candidatus Hungatella pullicola]